MINRRRWHLGLWLDLTFGQICLWRRRRQGFHMYICRFQKLDTLTNVFVTFRQNRQLRKHVCFIRREPHSQFSPSYSPQPPHIFQDLYVFIELLNTLKSPDKTPHLMPATKHVSISINSFLSMLILNVVLHCTYLLCVMELVVRRIVHSDVNHRPFV